MIDLGVFFAVLMVGFAFVWRRGDLDWVRAVRQPATPQETAALWPDCGGRVDHERTDIYGRVHVPQPWLLAHDFDALDPWIEVRRTACPNCAAILRDESDLAFNMLHCITGVDYFEPDAKKAAKVDWQPHVELIYHLSSLVHRHRLVLKVRLPRWQDDGRASCPRSPASATFGARPSGTSARCST